MTDSRQASVDRGDSRIDGTVVDGVLHGTTRISADGAPVAVLRYAHGLLFGPATLFHPTGQPSAQLNYVDGKLDGKAVYYAQDGSVQREAHYARGVLNGESVTYFPDGTVLERANYRQGALHGVSQRLHPNGRLAEQQLFREGQPLRPAEGYASDGRPLGADGRPVPRWKRWWQAVGGTSGGASSAQS